jgi:hypothetical protein
MFIGLLCSSKRRNVPLASCNLALVTPPDPRHIGHNFAIAVKETPPGDHLFASQIRCRDQSQIASKLSCEPSEVTNTSCDVLAHVASVENSEALGREGH